MTQQQIMDHCIYEIGRTVADLNSESSKVIESTRRELSSRGMFHSGEHISRVVKEYLNLLDNTIKSIFKITEETVLEFGCEFDEHFEKKMVSTLDDYFNGFDLERRLKEYFDRFSHDFFIMSKSIGWELELSKIHSWYLNNITPFSFKLRNKVTVMKNQRSDKYTVIGNGNKIVNAESSTVIIGDNVNNAENADAVKALEKVIEFLIQNKGIGEGQDKAIETLSSVKDELSKPAPDKSKVKELMFQVFGFCLKHADKLPPFIDAMKGYL